MKITRETDHATKCVLFLAEDPESRRSVSEIAKKCGIPRSFLAKILQKLTKAGIVDSSQGNTGGFRLCRKPEQISLYDVFRVIQGPMAVNACVVDQQFCDRVRFCSVHPVWVEIQHDIVQKLESTNFKALLGKASGYISNGIDAS